MLSLLKRFWSCRVRGVHVFGRPVDREHAFAMHGYSMPPGSYKFCKHCPTVRAVRRRKGKVA